MTHLQRVQAVQTVEGVVCYLADFIVAQVTVRRDTDVNFKTLSYITAQQALRMAWRYPSLYHSFLSSSPLLS